MAMLVSDLRFAIRSLRQAPGFSVLASLVLAVGIGTTSDHLPLKVDVQFTCR